MASVKCQEGTSQFLFQQFVDGDDLTEIDSSAKNNVLPYAFIEPFFSFEPVEIDSVLPGKFGRPHEKRRGLSVPLLFRNPAELRTGDFLQVIR